MIFKKEKLSELNAFKVRELLVILLDKAKLKAEDIPQSLKDFFIEDNS